MYLRTLLIPVSAITLLSACALTRVTPPEPVTPPAQYKDTGVWQRSQAAAAQQVPDRWWELFKDPVLNDLASRVVVGNENLKVLRAQVASAQAVVDASRSAMWPSLSVSAGATRSDNPSNGSSITAAKNPSTTVSLSTAASWEIDLWGRLAQASSGAQASLQASTSDLASAKLSAQATLVQTYLSWRTVVAQAQLLTRTVQSYQRSLDLTQVRYDSGVASRSDVLQAQSQLKSVQAQLAESNAQRVQLENAMAVLVGLPPSAFQLKPIELNSSDAALPTPPPVPTMLPSTLLERRPDIVAARSRVEAAYAQLGVTNAAYFPTLNLAASAGYRHNSLADLISAPNLFWSIGPSLTEVLFNGGQRQLASAQAKASADQATANYRQTVLVALQEVEDNLALAENLQNEAQATQEALQYAQSNLDIVTEQYRGGTVSYLNVVAAQTSALNAESSLLTVRNRQLAAINQLLKNIAGRWDANP